MKTLKIFHLAVLYAKLDAAHFFCTNQQGHNRQYFKNDAEEKIAIVQQCARM